MSGAGGRKGTRAAAHDDESLLRIARDFRDGILGKRHVFGMCAAVSWPLQGFMSSIGIESRLDEVKLDGQALFAEHCFLRLPDGRVLDPTADQFGLSAVYLGPMPDYQKLAEDEDRMAGMLVEPA